MRRTTALPANMRNEYLQELDSLTIPDTGNGLGYVSVFCGGGGLDLGFTSAGFKPLFSSDIVPAYCETIKQNLAGHIAEPHDITALSGKSVVERVGAAADVVIGGPPCQSFSILGGRKSTADPRGQLVYQYARFIREVGPKAFLFENVPGIEKKKRAEMPELPVQDRIKTFEEADLVLQEEDAIRESKRCLACCRICYNKDVAA